MTNLSQKIELRDRFHTISVTVFIVVLLVKFSVWPWEGSGTTPDSYSYFSASQSFSSTGTFGKGFVHWPPFYPISLSLYVLFLPNYAVAASYFNATIFLFLLFGCWRIIVSTLSSDKASAIFMMLVAFSPPIELVFQYAWSESSFIFFSFFCLYFWSRFFLYCGKVNLILSSLLLMLALLTRHVGIAVVLTLLFSLLFFYTSFGLRKFVWLFFIGLFSTLPYFAWIVRTLILSQTITGPRESTVNGNFAEFFLAYSKIIAHWYFPHSYFTDSAYLAAALTISLLLALSYLANSVFTNYLHKRIFLLNKQNMYISHIFAFLCVCFIFCYSTILLFTASLIRFDHINDRLMAPLAVPLFFVLVYTFHFVNRQLGTIKKKLLAIFFVTWFSLWLFAPNSLTDSLLSVFSW